MRHFGDSSITEPQKRRVGKRFDRTKENSCNLLETLQDVRCVIYIYLIRTVVQTLRDSFSVVSKPNFASKYSLETDLRDPSDFHPFYLYNRTITSLRFLSKIATLKNANFECYKIFVAMFADFNYILNYFSRIFTNALENAD